MHPGLIRTRQVTLEDAARAGGAVVVIDVLRAFTLAALALQAGATAIRSVATVAEALAVKAASPPGTLVMGELHTRPVPEFDLGNSPTELLARDDVRGNLLVHRSSAGTQGLVRAAPQASALIAAAFVNAGATARALRDLDPAEITFVLTGADERRDGDEDRACADYLTALLEGAAPDPGPYLRRVVQSDTGRLFDGRRPDLPRSDLDHALRLDAVDFALVAQVSAAQPAAVDGHQRTVHVVRGG